jgi:tetrahydromethanopterin S-methyltransferase subunit E
MAKFGYISILTGILILIGYVMYQLMIDLAMPFLIKLGLILIVLGVVVIIIRQIVGRKAEKEEADEYKKY